MKQVNLLFDVPDYVRVILRIDLQRTQQILINFLSNAIKFAPERSTVRISLGVKVDKLSKKIKTRISVEDKGIGMNEED